MREEENEQQRFTLEELRMILGWLFFEAQGNILPWYKLT